MLWFSPVVSVMVGTFAILGIAKPGKNLATFDNAGCNKSCRRYVIATETYYQVENSWFLSLFAGSNENAVLSASFNLKSLHST